MSQSKTRLLELNARLAQNLVDKGVEATADETTTDLVDKVADISTSKEEQEISVDITENGTTEILPDEGKSLSKVTVNVDVPSEEFIGIKYSDFTTVDGFNLPQTADARSLLVDDTNSHVVSYYMFVNNTRWTSGGYNAILKTIYMPSGIIALNNTFTRCTQLTDVHGDLSTVATVGQSAFLDCLSLKNIPYMPELKNLGQTAFANCTGLTKLNIYKKVEIFASNAFQGCTNLLDIYVPWAEGEVADAPWGATNATIHYNTQFDENHNPIVSEV